MHLRLSAIFLWQEWLYLSLDESLGFCNTEIGACNFLKSILTKVSKVRYPQKYAPKFAFSSFHLLYSEGACKINYRHRQGKVSKPRRAKTSDAVRR